MARTPGGVLLECVANISEGADRAAIEHLAGAAGPVLLDVHSDRFHHRSVFTMGGPANEVESSARSLAAAAVRRLDLGGHVGAHPRLGVVDVVPFVPLPMAPRPDLGRAVAARDRFGRWAAEAERIPVFLYGPGIGGPGIPGPCSGRSGRPPGGPAGPDRTLPEIRRGAFASLRPDLGPSRPHPTAGATAVGARGALVAYNLWITAGSPALARTVAASVRGPGVRALGFDLDGAPQVSVNLTDPFVTGPAGIYDRVARALEQAGAGVARAELVGLLPAGVLATVPRHRWAELALDPAATVEGRLEARVRR